jgi:hypothetical protein|nr:phosphatidate cytidylyltransferase [uncultured Mucilaginibacter sp.]
MKKLNLFLFAALLFTLSSCSVISGIFKAGAAVGIIAVIVIIGIILWIVSAFRGKQ